MNTKNDCGVNGVEALFNNIDVEKLTLALMKAKTTITGNADARIHAIADNTGVDYETLCAMIVGAAISDALEEKVREVKAHTLPGLHVQVS